MTKQASAEAGQWSVGVIGSNRNKEDVANIYFNNSVVGEYLLKSDADAICATLNSAPALKAEVEALRAALKLIDGECVSAMLTASKDVGDWVDDIESIRSLVSAALAAQAMSGIFTEYWRKPGPGADWTAHFEDYDGAPDAHCPIGFGMTEQEAIDDLLAKQEENQ